MPREYYLELELELELKNGGHFLLGITNKDGIDLAMKKIINRTPD